MIDKDDFKEMIESNNRVSYKVKIEIEPMEFANLGGDGINELLCDEAVEDGHLLEDMTFNWTFDECDGLCIEVHADASSWLEENSDNAEDE